MHQLSEEAINWGVYLRLPIVDNCRHSDFAKFCDIVAGGHFGIVSPHRSFPHHDESLHKGMRPGGDPEIYTGDQTVISIIDGDCREYSHHTLVQAHNYRAWRKLCSSMTNAGFNPLPISGVFKEQGGKPILEAALVLPGIGYELLFNTARIYNQDSFIYASGGAVQVFTACDRGASGLPISYVSETIGSTRTADDLTSLIKRLYA